MLLFEYFGLIFHNKVMGYINMGNWVEGMVDWINNIANWVNNIVNWAKIMFM